MKEERSNDAHETLQNALGFFDLLQYKFRDPPAIGGTRKKVYPLEAKMIDTQWNYISCRLKVGRTADVRH